MRDAQPKAIALLSGGLDSTLAVKLMLEQGIAVEALNFHTPFCQCNTRGGCEATRVARELGFPCRTLGMVDAFFERIRQPRYGYGSGMNPCLDCRILMFSKARQHMVKTGADFVFTGEVVGERPMSQRLDAMRIIERDSGLEGYLLRPLSAKLLPPTVPEQRGLVDRDRLLAIQGRSRKPQMALADVHGIDDYPCPAGGCLLTDRGFARRMRDLVAHEPRFQLNDVNLLRVGRHFRVSPDTKVVVGRNEGENARIVALARAGDLLLEVEGWGSPTTLVRGPAGEREIGLAASMTVRYSDAPGRAAVRCRRPEAEETWDVDAAPADETTLDALRL
jgi:tRNA U34 2-thiouridine synthase MnmA/TrmU